MIEMPLLQTWWGKLRWVVALAVCAVLAYVARGFGKTSKQEAYKKTIEDYKSKKLDDILVREQYALEQRDSIIEAQVNETLTRSKELGDELVRIEVVSRARTGRMTPREIGEALNK